MRDKIVKIIEAAGKDCKYRVVTDEREFEGYLQKKLLEEVNEFIETPNNNEMADILEVLDTIMEFYGFNRYEIETEQELKRRYNGAFRERIILQEVMN